MADFNGLGLNLGNLARLSSARSRSISPENFSGEKGKGGMSTDGPAAQMARDLGQGWKVSPFVIIQPGETFTLADIDGSGAIQQIWMTLARGAVGGHPRLAFFTGEILRADRARLRRRGAIQVAEAGVESIKR